MNVNYPLGNNPSFSFTKKISFFFIKVKKDAIKQKKRESLKLSQLNNVVILDT